MSTLPKPPATYGEEVVRVAFDPSTSNLVSRIKNLHAQLIDLVFSMDTMPKSRGTSDAPIHEDELLPKVLMQSMDALELSSMYAVKAATTPSLLHSPARALPMPDKATLLPHQVRVVDELEELGARTEKLALFFGTDIYATLDAREQQRLRRQFTYMLEYQMVLGDRITAFVTEA
jgi:hypothetical protein